jgi:hypothetical protein
VRVAVPDTRIPAAPELAGALVPTAEGIFAELSHLVGG